MGLTQVLKVECVVTPILEGLDPSHPYRHANQPTHAHPTLRSEEPEKWKLETGRYILRRTAKYFAGETNW